MSPHSQESGAQESGTQESGTQDTAGARFHPGMRVRVKSARPERIVRMHLRTPHYVRGREGVVTRTLGRFPNPEDLAFARAGEPRILYHVEFPQPPVWNEGEPGDTLLVELFEHWLEEA